MRGTISHRYRFVNKRSTPFPFDPTDNDLRHPWQQVHKKVPQNEQFPPTIVIGCLLCVFTIVTRGEKFSVFAALLGEIPQGYIISKERRI